jgi:hypothetical protein
MKMVLRIIGVLAIILGAIWILQGLNILPGSFMTGHMQWAYYGAFLGVVGVVLLIVSRGGRSKP